MQTKRITAPAIRDGKPSPARPGASCRKPENPSLLPNTGSVRKERHPCASPLNGRPCKPFSPWTGSAGNLASWRNEVDTRGALAKTDRQLRRRYHKTSRRAIDGGLPVFADNAKRWHRGTRIIVNIWFRGLTTFFLFFLRFPLLCSVHIGILQIQDPTLRDKAKVTFFISTGNRRLHSDRENG